MAGLHKDISIEQPTLPIDPQKNKTYEDEINVLDCFCVLWRHKFLILLGSILPALIVGLIFYFSPRSYRTTYVYDIGDYGGDYTRNWDLNEKKFNILLVRFYSSENLKKIVYKLRESSFNNYANQIANSVDTAKTLLQFKPSPIFTDISKAKIIGDGQLANSTLSLIITGNSKNDITTISTVIRDNFEKVVPLYWVQEYLSANIRKYKTMMADIDGNRFTQELELQKNRAILVEMKKKNSTKSNLDKTRVFLPFDSGVDFQYLPMEYQIQAIESKLIQFEEKIKESEAKYDYYNVLLAVNEKLLADLKNKMDSNYTIQGFVASLATLRTDSENRASKDFLKSFSRKIENRISISSPVAEEAGIYPVARSIAKKISIIFVLSLMISLLASFLIEALRKIIGCEKGSMVS